MSIISILIYVTPVNDSLLIIAAVDIIELVILSRFDVSTIVPFPLPLVEAPRTNLFSWRTGCTMIYDELVFPTNDVPFRLSMMLSISSIVNVLLDVDVTLELDIEPKYVVSASAVVVEFVLLRSRNVFTDTVYEGKKMK